MLVILNILTKMLVILILANIFWLSVIKCEPIDSVSQTGRPVPEFNTSKSDTKPITADVSSIKDYQSCGYNEYYDECPKYCIQTCDEPERKLCVSHSGCEPRCVCKQGFIRLSNWTCARPQDCPLNVCGENQHYSECGTKCPLTCDNYHNPPYCGDECFRGCFCNYGYVKGNRGKCIKRNECILGVEQNCGENEYYDEKGSACPPNTDDLNPQCPNVKPVSGCFCSKGYIRGAISKVCVPFKVNDIYSPQYTSTKQPLIDQSPVSNQRCPLNEVYLTCGRDCGRRCSDYDKNPVCSNDCFDACFCAPEYVRDDITEKCVRPKDCSKHSRTTTQSPTRVCPSGMKYYTCSQCSAACTHYDRRYYRDKRSSHRVLPNRNWYWLSGKCLWPYQCDTIDLPINAYDTKRNG